MPSTLARSALGSVVESAAETAATSRCTKKYGQSESYTVLSVLRLMVKTVHYLKDPKLWEL